MIRMALPMALYLGLVPHSNAPASEKIAWLVVVLAIIVCFDRVSPSSRPATAREIVGFILLAVVLWTVTVSFPSWWHVLGAAWKMIVPPSGKGYPLRSSARL